MNPKQFYLTLPSNSAAENTAAEFTTSLPININLEGNWECALVEIIYLNSWFNISEKDNLLSFIDIENKTRQVIKIPRGRYEDIDDLLNTLTTSVEIVAQRDKVSYHKFLSFSYIPLKKTVQLKINRSKIKSLNLSRNIIYMLGFRENDILKIDYSQTNELIMNAHHPADLGCAMNYLYIYCDILEPQIIGTILAPLLQVVNVEGKYTDIVSRIYTAPHYVPVLKKHFSHILINIKDDQNQPIDFTFGKTIVKMHFRKIQE